MTAETLLEDLATIGDRLVPLVPYYVTLAVGLLAVAIMALLVLGSMRP